MVHKDEKKPTRSWERVTYGYTRMRKTLPGHGRGSHMVHKDEKNPTTSWERVTYGT